MFHHAFLCFECDQLWLKRWYVPHSPLLAMQLCFSGGCLGAGDGTRILYRGLAMQSQHAHDIFESTNAQRKGVMPAHPCVARRRGDLAS